MPKKTTRGKPKSNQKSRRPQRAKRNTENSQWNLLTRNDQKMLSSSGYQMSKILPFKPMEPVRDTQHGWGQRSFFSLPISAAYSQLEEDPGRAGMFNTLYQTGGAYFTNQGASLPVNPGYLGAQASRVGEVYSKFRTRRLCLSYIPDITPDSSGSFTLAYFDDILHPVPISALDAASNFSGQMIEQQFSCASRVGTYCCLDVPIKEQAQLWNCDSDSDTSKAGYRNACQGKLVAITQSQAKNSVSNVYRIGRFVLHAVIDYFAPGLANVLDPIEQEAAEAAMLQELGELSNLRHRHDVRNETEKYISVSNPVNRTAGPAPEVQEGKERQDERSIHDKSPRPTSNSYRIFG